MGGIFGVASKNSCVSDLFFGTDYHSHLGTRRGGMAVYDKVHGFDRAIHNIQNSPFRTKFERDVEELEGKLHGQPSLQPLEVAKARRLECRLVTARCVLQAALLRRESRGSHYREDFPEIDPAQERQIQICGERENLSVHFAAPFCEEKRNHLCCD